MQTISENKITQGIHGIYRAVDIGRYQNGVIKDLDYYAPEDGVITVVDTTDNDTCGRRLKLKGATGEHGFCHNDTIYVKVGQSVKRGQKLAKMGYTGLTDPDNDPDGTHVHWVLNINGAWVYPPSKINQSFIKLGEEMLSKDQLVDLWVMCKGRGPTEEERARYIGKTTYAELRADLLASDAFKARIKAASEGKLNPVSHLTTPLKQVYVAPPQAGVTILSKGKYEVV